MTATVSIVRGAERMAALHAAELPQKDELCGAFSAAVVLRAAGVEESGGEVLDQDLVARVAGTTLAEHGDPDALPPGEGGRTDYRLEHPTVADPARAGTSATGLARSGAQQLVAEGALGVLDAVVAVHVHPEVEGGPCRSTPVPSTRPARTSPSRSRARGAHGAYPHHGRDPVLALAHVVVALHGLVGRRIDPMHSAVLSVGRSRRVRPRTSSPSRCTPAVPSAAWTCKTASASSRPWGKRPRAARGRTGASPG